MNRRALRVLGLLLIPLLAFALGLRVMDASTGWPQVSKQLERRVELDETSSCHQQLKPKLEPMRWVVGLDVQLQPGWSSADLCRLHSQLEGKTVDGKSGRDIYRHRLRADRIFLVAYGLALLFSMWRLGRLMQSGGAPSEGQSRKDPERGHRSTTVRGQASAKIGTKSSGFRYWQLGLLLPLLCMVSDALEDWRLLALWQALADGTAQASDVGLASLATIAKMGLFSASAFVIGLYGLWASTDPDDRPPSLEAWHADQVQREEKEKNWRTIQNTLENKGRVASEREPGTAPEPRQQPRSVLERDSRPAAAPEDKPPAHAELE